MTESLEILIKECVAGKARAREKLYQLLSPKMWGVCLRYSANTDEAKDVMQEGFIKVFDHINKFEGRGNFEGWVRRIMVNTALGEFRKKHLLFVDSSNYTEHHGGENPSIESELSAAELIKMIQELTPQYRLVFNLYAVEGYSHKEIAEILEISEGTSKSNLSRARDILQQKVKKHYSYSLNIG